ncbi:retrovirus-related Pol polyprotein from transposon RE2 [Elaeis guineensis]
MQGEFEISMMGELIFFLGLQIKQTKEGISIIQSKYTRELLKRFVMKSSKAIGTPMSPSCKLDKDEGEHLKMGIIRSSFSFLLGTGCGIYIAQNYNVPNIKKLANTWLFVAKHIEETYRKPKQKDDD